MWGNKKEEKEDVATAELPKTVVLPKLLFNCKIDQIVSIERRRYGVTEVQFKELAPQQYTITEEQHNDFVEKVKAVMGDVAIVV